MQQKTAPISRAEVLATVTRKVQHTSDRFPGDADAMVRAVDDALGPWRSDWVTSLHGGGGGPVLWAEHGKLHLMQDPNPYEEWDMQFEWIGERWQLTALQPPGDLVELDVTYHDAAQPLVVAVLNSRQFEAPNVYLWPDWKPQP